MWCRKRSLYVMAPFPYLSEARELVLSLTNLIVKAYCEVFRISLNFAFDGVCEMCILLRTSHQNSGARRI